MNEEENKMLVAQDFRDKARSALSGKWALALGTGLVASLLGAGTYMLGGGSGGSGGSIDDSTISSMQNMSEEEIAMIAVMVGAVLLFSLVISIGFLLLGGPITLGYVKFNLDLVDGKEPSIDALFSQFNRFGDGFLMQLLRRIYVSLWTLLFCLPGIVIGIVIGVLVGISGSGDETLVAICMVVAMLIGIIPGTILAAIKQYSYAMAPYILYENPGMKANEAITKSKELMNGNKWRLFCLLFSFTGWALLSVFFSCGIGHLWLNPYMEASVAIFYREIYAERYGRPYDYQSYEQPVNSDTYNPYNEGSYLQ